MRRYYIVTLVRGGAYRIKAESASEARQIMTYDYRERVASVSLDDNQDVNSDEDY